jgi:hypothetical protein
MHNDNNLDFFIDEHGNRIKWKLAYEELQKKVVFVGKTMFNYAWKHGDVFNENRKLRSLIRKQTKEMESDNKKYIKDIDKLRKGHTKAVFQLTKRHEKEIKRFNVELNQKNKIIEKLSRIKPFVRKKIAKLRKKFLGKKRVKYAK